MYQSQFKYLTSKLQFLITNPRKNESYTTHHHFMNHEMRGIVGTIIFVFGLIHLLLIEE